MDLSKVIKRPLITEKTTGLTSQGKFTFVVDKKADKEVVKKAVERFFNVDVKKVWLMTVLGKKKKVGRRRNRITKRPDWKKAVVQLAKDQKIDLFETQRG